MKQLGDIELVDFDFAAVWAADVAGCGDESLTPRPDLADVPENVHGLWVRFRGDLNDGTPVVGIAMAECPPPNLLLHSFFIGQGWHSLHFSPAPQFVLEHDGPDAFARRLGRAPADVLPIRIRTDVPASTTGAPIEQTLEVAGPVV